MQHKNEHGARTPITQSTSRKRCKHTRSPHTKAHLMPSPETQSRLRVTHATHHQQRTSRRAAPGSSPCASRSRPLLASATAAPPQRSPPRHRRHSPHLHPTQLHPVQAMAEGRRRSHCRYHSPPMPWGVNLPPSAPPLPPRPPTLVTQPKGASTAPKDTCTAGDGQAQVTGGTAERGGERRKASKSKGKGDAARRARASTRRGTRRRGRRVLGRWRWPGHQGGVRNSSRAGVVRGGRQRGRRARRWGRGRDVGATSGPESTANHSAPPSKLRVHAAEQRSRARAGGLARGVGGGGAATLCAGRLVWAAPGTAPPRHRPHRTTVGREWMGPDKACRPGGGAWRRPAGAAEVRARTSQLGAASARAFQRRGQHRARIHGVRRRGCV